MRRSANSPTICMLLILWLRQNSIASSPVPKIRAIASLGVHPAVDSKKFNVLLFCNSIFINPLFARAQGSSSSFTFGNSVGQKRELPAKADQILLQHTTLRLHTPNFKERSRHFAGAPATAAFDAPHGSIPPLNTKVQASLIRRSDHEWVAGAASISRSARCNLDRYTVRRETPNKRSAFPRLEHAGIGTRSRLWCGLPGDKREAEIKEPGP